MSDDLVERLRELAAPPYDSACFGGPMRRAADEIERLSKGWQESRIASSFSEDRAMAAEQRVEAAEAKLAECQGDLESHKWAGDRVKAAEAEVARLREALTPFSLFYSAVKRRFDADKILESVVQIEHQALTVGAFINARQALAQQEQDNG